MALQRPDSSVPKRNCLARHLSHGRSCWKKAANLKQGLANCGGKTPDFCENLPIDPKVAFASR